MKKYFKVILPIVSSIQLFSITSLTSCNKTHLRLKRNDWEEQTKTAINQCLSTYGVDGKSYSKDNYVVFDFDNTSAIFDIAHQCSAYQIEHMAYNLTKEQMRAALSADLGDVTRSLTEYGFDFTYQNLISDIVTSYGKLETKYGPFTYKGVDDSKLTQLHQDDDWIDFSAKLRYMIYTVVAKVEGDTNRCKWGTYLFSGMTPEQVYDVEYRCLSYNSNVDSRYDTWESLTPITGSNTIASTKFVQGISVTDNIKELYKAIKNNGIDIWIVSASQIDQVIAAADVFGLSQYVTGAFALTNKLGSDGVYVPAYDNEGKGYVKKDGKWVKTEVSNPYYTSGEGKSLTIKNSIAPSYNNHGPIMCFGDSTGDFNFCTEFKDTKLVVCFNRADRSVKDGGGLMSAIAIYQKVNDITLEKANNNNDTLYCLQGRNDNGKRSFRNSNKTIRLGLEKEQLFYNADNYTLLSYIMSNELTIAQACNLSKKTTIEGISVGFLDSYIGYHTR